MEDRGAVEVMARAGRKKVLEWIKEDYKSHPVRFCIEVAGMFANLMASIILMLYSPTPPMFWAYVFFLTASVLLMSAAFSRQSFGFTAMYFGYLIIDFIGFWKTL